MLFWEVVFFSLPPYDVIEGGISLYGHFLQTVHV